MRSNDVEIELSEYIVMLDSREEKLLDKQMNNGLRLLNRWEQIFREGNKNLFEYMLETKIPYWKRWVKKYKWVAPSIPAHLEEVLEVYKSLRLYVK